MSRREGTLKLSSNIEPRASAPLDARLVVPTLADLTASGAFPYPYVGMIVSVQAEGKAYMLTASDPTVSANWTEIGAGGSGQTIQVTELPAPTAALNGTIYQYVGDNDSTTTPELIRGRFYLCHAGIGAWVWDIISVQDDPRISVLSANAGDKSRVYLYVGTTDSDYIKGHIYAWDSTENAWVDISPWVTECDRIFHGTLDEWDALPASEKAKYSFIATPDEAVEDIADAVIDGDMRAVTSNAVFDYSKEEHLIEGALPSGGTSSIPIKGYNTIELHILVQGTGYYDFYIYFTTASNSFDIVDIHALEKTTVAVGGSAIFGNLTLSRSDNNLVLSHSESGYNDSVFTWRHGLY